MKEIRWSFLPRVVGLILVLTALYLPLELTIFGRGLKGEEIRDRDYPFLTVVRFIAESLNFPQFFYACYFGLPIISIALFVTGVCLIFEKKRSKSNSAEPIVKMK